MQIRSAIRNRFRKTGWIATLTGLPLLMAMAAGAQDLTVFAAASLNEALDGVAQQFQRATGQKVVVSYAATPALAKQIENGAPADVFISADPDWMDYVAQRKLINVSTRANLLRNRLVLIAPADGKVQTDIKPGFPLAKLMGGGKLAMADPDSVSAGKYGKAALEKLGVWSSVERNVARADNVRTALNFVARGEAPFGVVYETDAFAEKKVRVISRFPQDTHPAIIYPVAVVVASKHAGAPVFVNYLKSSEARVIFEKYGFSMDR